MPGLGAFGIHLRLDGSTCTNRAIVRCEACGWINPAVYQLAGVPDPSERASLDALSRSLAEAAGPEGEQQ